MLNEIAQLLGPGDLRQKNATLKSIEDVRETRAEMIDRRLNIPDRRSAERQERRSWGRYWSPNGVTQE